jgi:hypothetical protein
MACGLAVVASRLKGVTDALIDEGRTGYLFGVGRVGEAARRVAELAGDPARLEAMWAAAREAAVERFSSVQMAERYAALVDGLEDASTEAEAIRAGLDLRGYRGPWWHRWVPRRLKAMGVSLLRRFQGG